MDKYSAYKAIYKELIKTAANDVINTVYDAAKKSYRPINNKDIFKQFLGNWKEGIKTIEPEEAILGGLALQTAALPILMAAGGEKIRSDKVPFSSFDWGNVKDDAVDKIYSKPQYMIPILALLGGAALLPAARGDIIPRLQSGKDFAKKVIESIGHNNNKLISRV